MVVRTEDGSLEFRFFRPSVSRVAVVGDVNGAEHTLALQPQGDGWWTAKTKLPAGEYLFRYVADCHWFADHMSDDQASGTVGWDSVCLIDKAGDITPQVTGNC